MNTPVPGDPATRPSGRPEGRPVADGARAAGLLEAASHPAPTGSTPSGEDSLRLETIRGLARDLGRQLEALDRLSREDNGPDVLVEAALRCADLATLAACAVPHLPADDARGSPAHAARLAADAVRTLDSAFGAGGGGPDGERPGGEHGENLLRDMRSAAWRADLAARQVARQVAGPAEGGSTR